MTSLNTLWLMGVRLTDDTHEYVALVKSNNTRKVYRIPVTRDEALALAPRIGESVQCRIVLE